MYKKLPCGPDEASSVLCTVVLVLFVLLVSLDSVVAVNSGVGVGVGGGFAVVVVAVVSPEQSNTTQQSVQYKTCAVM